MRSRADCRRHVPGELYARSVIKLCSQPWGSGDGPTGVSSIKDPALDPLNALFNRVAIEGLDHVRLATHHR